MGVNFINFAFGNASFSLLKTLLKIDLNQITTRFSVLATSISSLLLKYDVSQLSVELAQGRYTSLSVIISRVFQR